jgi:DNA-binding NtrC family response regulator
LFLEELYYLLNVIPLRIPPLRERREEIPLLARYFLKILRPPGTPLPSITGRALDALVRYAWPGNVRQLRNEMERALVFTGSEPAPMIDLKDLSPVLGEALEAAVALRPPAGEQRLPWNQDLDEVLAGAEKGLIEQVLDEYEGQVSAAAQALGLTRQGLYKKMKRLGIDAARSHASPEARRRGPGDLPVRP